MDCKKALFTSFLEATIWDIIVPKNGWKDRIWEILNIIKNPLSKIDIVKYTKLIRYCTLNIKIDWYEVEDLIQEWLEKILRALKHYQWKWFAMPETYVRTIIINHFRDLRRMQFALKRWGEIITRHMWFYDWAILDKFSYRLWELMRNYDGWKLYSSDWKIIDPDLVLDPGFLFTYECPISTYGYFKNNNEKPKK